MTREEQDLRLYRMGLAGGMRTAGLSMMKGSPRLVELGDLMIESATEQEDALKLSDDEIKYRHELLVHAVCQEANIDGPWAVKNPYAHDVSDLTKTQVASLQFPYAE